MDTDLKGKNAVVCGSTRGIGKAIAMELADLGATVTLVARDAKLLETVCRELPAKGGQKHSWVAADFSDPEGLRKKMETQLGSEKTVHILVNNTGGPPHGAIFEATGDQFLKAFQMHILCNQILAQLFVPGMKKAKYGRIINVISISVKEPIPGLGISNTTRWAVASWAKTLAGELAPFGITVNNVLPGFTDTDRLRELFEAKAKKSGQSVEAMRDEALAKVPMGRLAAPSEIACGATFLATPAASYITGINLTIDGGRTGSL